MKGLGVEPSRVLSDRIAPPQLLWRLSHRADAFARDIADRHYNRQKVGTPQFVPPGRCLVLNARTETGRALWITSWPFAEYVKHAWPGAWVCSAFRNEGAGRASDLIRAAVAATRARWEAVPALGMVTFLDRAKVRPMMRRSRETWGHTWALAGFRHVGETAGGLMAWQLLPEDMPEADAAAGSQPLLFAQGFGDGTTHKTSPTDARQQEGKT